LGFRKNDTDDGGAACERAGVASTNDARGHGDQTTRPTERPRRSRVYATHVGCAISKSLMNGRVWKWRNAEAERPTHVPNARGHVMPSI
jgi:hypothetical protein